MSYPASAHLFCRVIDNFGDIGVCWRLARQMCTEHGMAVTLWVDDLASFQRLCPELRTNVDQQQVAGVQIRQWNAEHCQWDKEANADLVIEAFACHLPEDYVRAMAHRSRKPVWINLEYLSAENWVEGCHTLPSPHSHLPLTKYFFFPGFSSSTGGLPMERNLVRERDAFQEDGQKRNRFLTSLGIDQHKKHGCLISLFCYPTAPVTELFSALANEEGPSLCLVPEGVASEQVSQFLQQPARPGAWIRRGKLEVFVIPFLTQENYDRLLWSCDVNFVRGEDSMVRAQWAGQPFVWQIYSQSKDAHWLKLDAFLDRYADGLPAEAASTLISTWHAWNGALEPKSPWRDFLPCLPELRIHTRRWGSQLQNNGDLTSNLLRFAAKIG